MSAAANASGRRGREPGGAARGLRQRGGVGGHDRHAGGHRLEHRQPEALVARGQRERGRARVEAGQQRLVDVAEQADALEPRLARELRPPAAGGDDVDALGGERPRGGGERGEVLARRLRGDGQHVRAVQRQRPPRRLRVGGGREARIDAAGHHRRVDPEQLGQLAARELGHGDDPLRAPRDRRQHAPLPGRVGPRVPLGMAQGRGVVDDHDRPRMRQRRQVRRAQQRPRPRGPGREHDLLPRVPGAVREPRARRHDDVAARPQRRQPPRELARPPLDPAELGPHGRPRVDRDRAPPHSHASLTRLRFDSRGAPPDAPPPTALRHRDGGPATVGDRAGARP